MNARPILQFADAQRIFLAWPTSPASVPKAGFRCPMTISIPDFWRQHRTTGTETADGRYRGRPIDIVVVYKIDRLTRNLTDFAKLIEVFERRQVSFVSVTQQFNTTTSMGRLMLNVLLSLRPVRARSDRRTHPRQDRRQQGQGDGMGGYTPLGYRVENRRLVIEETEAKLVRHIFHEFVRCRSTTDLVKQLAANGRPRARARNSANRWSTNCCTTASISATSPQGEKLPRPARGDHRSGVVGCRSRHPRGKQPPAAIGDLAAPTAGCLIARSVLHRDGERYQPAHTRKANGKSYRYYVPSANYAGAGCQRSRARPAEPLSNWFWRRCMPC